MNETKPQKTPWIDPDFEADYAETSELKQIDQLFASAPTLGPSPDFVARFEARLERRVNRKRTWLGVSIISVVLMFATALLFWSVTDTGLALLNLLNNVDVVSGTVNLVQAGVASLRSLIRVAVLLGEAGLTLVQHPVVWGYISLGLGVSWLWTQILRRLSFQNQHTHHSSTV